MFIGVQSVSPGILLGDVYTVVKRLILRGKNTHIHIHTYVCTYIYINIIVSKGKLHASDIERRTRMSVLL